MSSRFQDRQAMPSDDRTQSTCEVVEPAPMFEALAIDKAASEPPVTSGLYPSYAICIGIISHDSLHSPFQVPTIPARRQAFFL